jgi:hypothetical protein
VFQHYNQIHHKEEMIYVLIQEMYHLNLKKKGVFFLKLIFKFCTNLMLFEFVINLKNDFHNFVLKQEDFHIDVSFL